MRDLLDGLYQYPGGWVADQYGRRRALTFFVSLAAAGYVIYWLAPSWPFVFIGLAFVMATRDFHVVSRWRMQWMQDTGSPSRICSVLE